MVLETEIMDRILTEVTLDMKPARPDTPEEQIFREKLTIEVAEIKARGNIVDGPMELPG